MFGLSRIEAILLGAIGVAILTVGVLWWTFDQGKKAQLGADNKATVETQGRINDADAHGPRTPADVGDRLRDGRF